jgi:lambda repressor-like predicted transcriptional regulator
VPKWHCHAECYGSEPALAHRYAARVHRARLRPTPNEARARIRALLEQHHLSAAALSRRLGRSSGWLGAYLRSTDDSQLPERDLEFIARFLGVEPEQITPHD